MSDERDPASSGTAPEERKPRRLFEKEEPQATAPPPLPPTPKVLFPAGSAPQGAPPQPSQERPKPAVLFGAEPKGPPVFDGKPKTLFGNEAVVRKRIPCAEEQLSPIDPSASPKVIGQALRIIEVMNLDDGRVEPVAAYGADIQKAHGALADEELALANDPNLSRGQEYVASMLTLFRMLNPDTVFHVKRGGISEFLDALFNDAESAEQLFQRNYPEIRSIAEKTAKLEPAVRELVRRLAALTIRYASLDDACAAKVIAANFIIQYVRGVEDPAHKAQYAGMADAFEARVGSLLTTRMTLKTGCMTLDALTQSATAIADSARGLLDEDLPLWQTSYAAALAAVRASKSVPTDSALTALRDSHARILSKLSNGKE